MANLSETLPGDLLALIGELTMLFGRLEHITLLALKRKNDISLESAEDIYKHYTLGAKLFGKQPCKNAGSNCREFGSAPGLMSLSSDIPDVKIICDKLQKLIEKRNSIMHGLIVNLDGNSVLLHRRKTFELESGQLITLRNELFEQIRTLNNRISKTRTQSTNSLGHTDQDDYTATSSTIIDIRLPFFDDQSDA